MTIEMQEHSVETVKTEIAGSMQTFCALALPDEITIPFPSTYEGLWDLIVSQRESVKRFAWGLPRGYAKTTLLKLLISYLLVHGIRKFPLIVCATERLAKNFLYDVVNILQSENIKKIYGEIEWTHDTAEYKLGHWKDTGQIIILQVTSSLAAIRGLNISIHRPDIILMDDIQTNENAASRVESERLKKWMFATLLKASDRNNALHLFIGNMYSKTCLLRILQQSPAWTSFITGSILQDGQTLWPEFRSLEQIQEIFVADCSVGEEDTFWAEEQNIPRDDIEHRLSLSGLELAECENRTGGYITVDPATGKKKSDNCAVAVHLVDERRLPYVVDGISERIKPKELLGQIIELVVRWDIKLVGIESVAFQSTLVAQLQERLTEKSIWDVQVVELYPGRQNKNARIKSWVQMVNANVYRVATQHILNLLHWELGFFDMLSTENKDDFLDVCSMGQQVFVKYPELWTENWRAAPLVSQVTDADFYTDCSYQDARVQ